MGTEERLEAAIAARLRAAGCVYAEEEAALLREAAAAAGDPAATLERMVADRVSGLPLETLVGWTDLDGVRVAVTPGVFVPRRRTAYLVRLAAAALRPGELAVDLCCGSGAVGAALAARVPGAEVHAADLDPVAVACARRNLPAERVHQGDLYAALPAGLRGRVAVLAVNAPYVPTEAIALMPPEARLHEPAAALDGGPDGLEVQRRVVAAAPTWLAPGGRLLIETGREQADRTAALMSAAGLAARVHSDPDLAATVVVGRVGRRPAPGG